MTTKSEPEHDVADEGASAGAAYMRSAVESLRPAFFEALAEDAIWFAANRHEPHSFRSRRAKVWNVLRLCWAADDYLGLTLYRLRTMLHARRVPIVPRLLHLFCTAAFGIRIGDHAVLKAGVYIPHGQIVIDGFVLVGHRCVLSPWTTLGVLEDGLFGPTLEDGVSVGTGAKVLGHVTVGAQARIGANAVVVSDIPAGATAVGVPAKIVGAY